MCASLSLHSCFSQVLILSWCLSYIIGPGIHVKRLVYIMKLRQNQGLHLNIKLHLYMVTVNQFLNKLQRKCGHNKHEQCWLGLNPACHLDSLSIPILSP